MITAFVCPSGWLQNSDHCFYFSDIEKSWSDAKVKYSSVPR